MRLRIILPRFLATIAVFGLLLTPYLRLAVAMPGDAMETAGESMSGKMPSNMACCPDEAPVMDCTEECPFLALCVMGTVLNLPVCLRLLTSIDIQNLKLPDKSAKFTNLSRDPPFKPPQS